MKICDKVRFLNDVGGGRISGFRDKNTVLVEDEDGFEFPANIHECIVVDSDNYEKNYSSKSQNSKPQTAETNKPTSVKAALNMDSGSDEDREEDASTRPVTFRPKPEERPNADILNIYLCFVPIETKELTKTDFDTYLVNDSNYFIDFTYLSGEGNSWQLRYKGTAEPNSKHFIEKVTQNRLNDLQHLCLQMLAYKEDKHFLLKPSQSIELRPDLTRFYKLHTFVPNLFFNERVLTYEIVVNDERVRHTHTSAAELKEALTGNKETTTARPHIHAITIKKKNDGEPEIIDLHADELLDNTRGMQPIDILEYQLDIFRKKMEENKNKKGKKLIFIHGKGQGVLRNAVLRELNHTYKNCTSQDASFREYGFGATMVTIH